MKKILTSFLILLLIIIVNINIVSANYEFKKLSFLIKYVNTKIDALEKISKKYDLEEDIDIQSRISKLKEVNNILIQTKKTWKYNNYISQVVERLKENNTLIKRQLKSKIEDKKKEADIYSYLYHDKIDSHIKSLNKIVIAIATKLMEKDKLNSKDQQIVLILVLIKQKLNELNTITEKKWRNKKEIKEHIIFSFKQIINSFKQIKDITKSSK
jgi:DNA integrity scanning protein DisA with diadenylate cyclase activity